MAVGGKKTGMVSHSEKEPEIVTVLRSLHMVAVSWTSIGVKGKQVWWRLKPFNRKGRKGDRKGRQGKPS
jgi:hypothetical protein